jgi:protein SCO1/2
MTMHTSAGQRAGRAYGVPVRATWLARVLLAVWAGVCGGAGLAVPACAQARGSLGPAFELTDHNGRPFSSAALAGQPYAVFFGFTHCPDVCPTTLLEMSNNLKALGADADRLRIVFVTVDPERDTPEQLRQYLSSFDPRIVGLTGSEPQIAAVAKGWNAFHNKIPEADGSYTVVHSAYVYLMDRANRLVDTMGFLDTEPEQVAKLKALIEGSRQ